MSKASYYENLIVGQHVVLHDEWQCEISGTVRKREDLGDHICYLLELDSGGLYAAKLRKMN